MDAKTRPLAVGLLIVGLLGWTGAARGQDLSVHGWVYSLLDGCVRELGMDADSNEQLARAYDRALAGLGTPHGPVP